MKLFFETIDGIAVGDVRTQIKKYFRAFMFHEMISLRK
jgi:hypothetical protein